MEMTTKAFMIAIGVAALISVAAPSVICGNDENVQRWAQLGNAVWPQERMPLSISVANSAGGFSKSDVEQIAMKCARMWSAPASLSMQIGPSGSKGNIAISFKYIDGPWNTVGQGLSPKLYGDYSSYMYLDQDEKWKRSKDDSKEGVSLTWAICHEMGHNLGLSHSTYKEAIMYHSGTDQDESQLHWDDEAGITALYKGGDPKGKTTTQPTPRPTTRPFTSRPTQTQRPFTSRSTQRPFTSQSTQKPFTTRPTEIPFTTWSTERPFTFTNPYTWYPRYHPKGRKRTHRSKKHHNRRRG